MITIITIKEKKTGHLQLTDIKNISHLSFYLWSFNIYATLY